MSSFFPSLGSLSPVNTFPAYHGPHDVGTIDVEIPVADLPQPSDAPEDAVETICFRIFYPCHKPGKGETARPVRWIPQPQKATMNAFATFLGAGSKMASLISYLPQNLFWIKLPAYRNAKLLDPPTSNRRWPVAMFSHGLAGSRNAYSYVCGDMASKGMIVIAMDHRDGSSPIQFVRETSNTPSRTVGSVKLPHTESKETYEGRDKQLRIRLWEISTAFEALMKIDAGEAVNNLDYNTSGSKKERSEVLEQFTGLLDVHRPGKVSWAGHSFGGATTVQLLKSIYYNGERPSASRKALITPKSDAAIVQQITPESPALLLDIWCLPLQSPDQRWLYERPMPSYTDGGPMGDNILSVLSEAFFKWRANSNASIKAIAPPKQPHTSPTTREASKDGHMQPSWAHLRDESPASSARDSGYNSERSQSPANRAALNPEPADSNGRTKGPHMFYPEKSQHFNQSDFGVLFPWLSQRLTKAEEPERLLDLNVRAMVQVIREAGIEVSGENDAEILNKDAGIRRWVAIPAGDEEKVSRNELNAEALKRRLSVGESQAPRDEAGMGLQAIET